MAFYARPDMTDAAREAFEKWAVIHTNMRNFTLDARGDYACIEVHNSFIDWRAAFREGYQAAHDAAMAAEPDQWSKLVAAIEDLRTAKHISTDARHVLMLEVFELKRMVLLRLQAAQQREAALADALAFYADPDTYFAWSFIADQPAGDWGDDFDYDEEYGRDTPGKRARAAIAGRDVVALATEREALLDAAEHGCSLMLTSRDGETGLRLYHRCGGCEHAIRVLLANGRLEDVKLAPDWVLGDDHHETTGPQPGDDAGTTEPAPGADAGATTTRTAADVPPTTGQPATHVDGDRPPPKHDPKSSSPDAPRKT
jgi:hypothetical protein